MRKHRVICHSATDLARMKASRSSSISNIRFLPSIEILKHLKRKLLFFQNLLCKNASSISYQQDSACILDYATHAACAGYSHAKATTVGKNAVCLSTNIKKVMTECSFKPKPMPNPSTCFQQEVLTLKSENKIKWVERGTCDT